MHNISALLGVRIRALLVILALGTGLLVAQVSGAFGLPQADALGTVSAGGPYFGAVNSVITFTGTAVGATAPVFTWSFGDGGVAVGPTAIHQYNQPSTYVVTLTVTDPSSVTPVTATTIASVTFSGAVTIPYFPYQYGGYSPYYSGYNPYYSGSLPNQGCFTAFIIAYNCGYSNNPYYAPYYGYWTGTAPYSRPLAPACYNYNYRYWSSFAFTC